MVHEDKCLRPSHYCVFAQRRSWEQVTAFKVDGNRDAPSAASKGNRAWQEDTVFNLNRHFGLKTSMQPLC